MKYVNTDYTHKLNFPNYKRYYLIYIIRHYYFIYAIFNYYTIHNYYYTAINMYSNTSFLHPVCNMVMVYKYIIEHMIIKAIMLNLLYTFQY